MTWERSNWFRDDNIEQWFSTFGSWRPTKQNIPQFGDIYYNYSTKTQVLATQKWVATQLLRNTDKETLWLKCVTILRGEQKLTKIVIYWRPLKANVTHNIEIKRYCDKKIFIFEPWISKTSQGKLLTKHKVPWFVIR